MSQNRTLKFRLTDHPVCNTTGKRPKSMHLTIVEKRAGSESRRESKVPSR